MIQARLLLIAALAAGGAAQAAAAPADITPMTYDNSVSDDIPTRLASACAINIVQISDQRFSKDSIGTVFPVVASAPEPWINSGLDNLTAYGYSVRHGGQPVSSAINLKLRLIRAYTWNVGMRINGMVAFDVDVITAHGQHTEKFRAAGSKTNMWGAHSEYVTALNYAFNHTLHKMALALQSDCAQTKVAMQ